MTDAMMSNVHEALSKAKARLSRHEARYGNSAQCKATRLRYRAEIAQLAAAAEKTPSLIEASRAAKKAQLEAEADLKALKRKKVIADREAKQARTIKEGLARQALKRAQKALGDEASKTNAIDFTALAKTRAYQLRAANEAAADAAQKEKIEWLTAKIAETEKAIHRRRWFSDDSLVTKNLKAQLAIYRDDLKRLSEPF